MRFPLALPLLLLSVSLVPAAAATDDCVPDANVPLCLLDDHEDHNTMVEFDVVNALTAGVYQRSMHDETRVYAHTPPVNVGVRQVQFPASRETAVVVATDVASAEVRQSSTSTSCSNVVFVLVLSTSRTVTTPCGAVVPVLQDAAPFPDWPELP